MKLLPIPVRSLGVVLLWAVLPLAVRAAGEIETTAPPSIQLSQPVAEVLRLTHAKVNEDVTVAFIKNGDRRYTLSAEEIIYLRQQGVSDRVLTQMLERSHSASPLPPVAAPAVVSEPGVAVAPQYEAAPAISVIESSPPTTVYVGSSAPVYYSFYDPWPYWYDPWPGSYWGWSWWYPYPWFSCGYYWGSGCYDDHHDDCHKPPPNGHPNQPPPPNGNPPPGDPSANVAGNPRPTANPGALTGSAVTRTDATRAPVTTPPVRTGGPVAASGSGRSVPIRPVESSTSPLAARSASAQSPTRPTTYWTPTAANDRTAVSRAANPTAGNPVNRSATARPTSTWAGGGNRQAVVTARPIGSSAPAAVQVNAARTTTWSRPTSQAPSRPTSAPNINYQRSQSAPQYAPRASANFSPTARPTMAPSPRSVNSGGASRSAVSMSGGSASRPAAASRPSGGGRSR